MRLLRRLAALLGFAGAPALSETLGPVEWLAGQAGEERIARNHGPIDFGTDQLTAIELLLHERGPWSPETFAIPTGPAEFWTLHEPTQQRVAAALLVWSNTPAYCGEEVISDVDGPIAGFMSPAAALHMQKENLRAADGGQGAYVDWVEPQSPETSFARFMTLPGGDRFAGFSTGWGDGNYPVVRLRDKHGQTVAIYADFIGNPAKESFILPRPC